MLLRAFHRLKNPKADTHLAKRQKQTHEFHHNHALAVLNKTTHTNQNHMKHWNQFEDADDRPKAGESLMDLRSPDTPDFWLHFLRSRSANVATACNLFVLTCQKESKGMYQQGRNATARRHQLLSVMNYNFVLICRLAVMACLLFPSVRNLLGPFAQTHIWILKSDSSALLFATLIKTFKGFFFLIFFVVN